jgi:hypothetical protein
MTFALNKYATGKMSKNLRSLPTLTKIAQAEFETVDILTKTAGSSN